MTVRTLRRLAIAMSFVTVASAAWLLPRRPVAAAVLLGVVALAASFSWWVRRDERRLLAAGLACDLDSLERYATSGGARMFASFALIHHGGFARAHVAVHVRTMRARPHREQAYELAREQDPEGKDLPPVYAAHMIQLRLLTRLVAYAAAVEDDAPRADLPVTWVDAVVELADKSWSMTRWPIRLAAAREAAARGDTARARELIAAAPAWPAGSPLERVRQRLIQA